jgi:hypothetical protein
MAEPQRSRPFTLRDALALVAATALGFALTRSLSGFHAISRFDIVASGDRDTINTQAVLAGVNFAYSQASKAPTRWIPYVGYLIQRAVFWPSPCVAALTLSVLVMASISPQQQRYRPLRRPGVMAALASVVAFCVTAVLSPQTLLRGPPALSLTLRWQDWWALTWFTLPRTAGYAVALTWLSLFVSNRWSADRGWLDRLGRILGSCWIAQGSLSVLAAWLAMF